ncbi:MAG: hypothetical protein M3396_03350 [Actinomycetota bacterium]|nr:hypothetical protein [Actinomycetota bacterium]MDQ3575313.1 hypothetical protein [Actinomycetota bacterium]
MLGLQEEHVTIWWTTLGLGLVVVIAVIVLLSLLVALVKDIDTNVRETWDTATRLAANTATTWMLQQTATRVEDLSTEVDRHVQALSGGGRTTRGRRRR